MNAAFRCLPVRLPHPPLSFCPCDDSIMFDVQGFLCQSQRLILSVASRQWLQVWGQLLVIQFTEQIIVIRDLLGIIDLGRRLLDLLFLRGLGLNCLLRVDSLLSDNLLRVERLLSDIRKVGRQLLHADSP